MPGASAGVSGALNLCVRVAPFHRMLVIMGLLKS